MKVLSLDQINKIAGSLGNILGLSICPQIASEVASIESVMNEQVKAPPPAVIDGVLYGMDAEIATWVNERMGGGIVPTTFVGFGILREATPENFRKPDGQLDIVAGAYFHGWRDGTQKRVTDTGDVYEMDVSDIQVVVAVDNIASAHPMTLRKVLEYPFGQLKCRRITAEIEMSNERSIRSAQKLGFQLEGRKRFMASDGGDVGVFGLYPQTCPFWTQEAA